MLYHKTVPQTSLMVPLKWCNFKRLSLWKCYLLAEMDSNHFYQHKSIRIASGDSADEVKSSEQSKGTAASFNACSMDAIKTFQDPATEFWQRTLLLNTFIIVCTLSRKASHAVLSYRGEKSLLVLSAWGFFNFFMCKHNPLPQLLCIIF